MTSTTNSPVLHDLLARRRSPRGFSADRPVDADSLGILLEAARWAPSANNSQPWRFGVARRGEPAFDALAAALAPGNQLWAPNAGALVLVAAQTVGDDGREQPWALYDAGQAAAHLTVQAQAEGLAVHQMGGFDPDAVSAVFGLDEHVRPVVVLAVGWHDPQAQLPEPFASRERAPRVRLPLGEILLPPVPVPAPEALPLSA